MKTLVGFLIAMSCLLLVRSLVSGHPAVVPAGQANGPALLAIPTDIAAATGYSVTVPVAFQSSSNAVGSSTFSLDFDESCLAFDATDGNNDGRPDSVRFTTPLAFRSSVSYNGADLDGELDVVIADYSLPIASLPDLPELMTVRFTAFCAPAAGEPIMAPVRFSTAPVASFGDVNGLDVESSVSDGAVVIYETLPSTPTPTITPTTAPVTPSVTPTPGTPTPAPGTPTPTVMPTVTASPATPVPTAPASNWLYLPVINQAGP